MYKLFEFIRRTYLIVLFVALELGAIGYYARSSPYTEARLLTAAHHAVGGLQGTVFSVRGYFGLRSENRALVDRIAALEERLSSREAVPIRPDTMGADTLLRTTADTLRRALFEKPYTFTSARVVRNSINRSHNFLIVDKGRDQGVERGMGVISATGAMVGYVAAADDRYAAVVPMLNTSFRASGKIQGADYFGSIYWDGADRYHVQMKELSKYAAVREGAAVISTGFSQYFPEGVLIGYVERFELSENQMAYHVQVRLAEEPSGLSEVLLVRARDAEVVEELEAAAARQTRAPKEER